MLRHFKMELKRQQALELGQTGGADQTHIGLSTGSLAANSQNIIKSLTAAGDTQAVDLKHRRDLSCPKALAATKASAVAAEQQQHAQKQPSKRVRGRRSSKPAMEKRRRARINECLDILKSYVLTDSSQLNKLGIDLATNENQLDEESIARQILKTSGLINRHRGRKNPNKLEKADILELTVDYVRRLHEQRDELLMGQTTRTLNQHQHHQQQAMAAAAALQLVAQNNRLQQQSINVDLYHEAHQVPAHLSEPLTLDLSPKSRQVNTSTTPPTLQTAYRQPPNTPLTPPSSNGSSSSLSSADVNPMQQHNQTVHMQLLSQVLDAQFKPLYNWSAPPSLRSSQ